MFVLFYVGLVNLHELSVPVFRVDGIYDHENVRTELVMLPLLILQRDLQITVLSLGDTVDCL